MSTALQESDPSLCFCGRPARHAGHHIGHKMPARKRPEATGKPPKAKRFAAAVQTEIAACQATIARLTERVTALRDQLAEAKARLPLLTAVRDEYRSPQPAAPTDKPLAPPPTPFRMASIAPPSRCQSPSSSTTPGDFEPIKASFDEVLEWAQEQSVPFAAWDDLPAVNRCREDMELPLFKRDFTWPRPAKPKTGARLNA